MVVAGADTELGLGFSEYDTTKAAERGEGINLCNSNNYFSRYFNESSAREYNLKKWIPKTLM